MALLPKIAVVYLAYHSDDYLDDVVSAFKKVTYPKDKLELVIVDNPHPQLGDSMKAIEEKVMPYSGKEIPHVTVLPQKENLGFGIGNNAGITWALDHGFDYVYLHNDDGYVAPNVFEPLVEACEGDKNIAMAQSLLMLHPETEYLNNAGNCFHYLGFGYCDEYRTKRTDITLPPVKEISYASGSCCFLRAEMLKKYGGFGDYFFMYHEDLELSLRFRVLGFKTVLVSDSVFYHKYKFSRSIQKFFYMERNRYGVMLMFFKWPTLLLLLPMNIVLEIGLLLFAWRGGWLDKRVEVYKYWFNPKNWRVWLENRKKIQEMRQVPDKYLLKYSVGGVFFQEKSMENPILKYIGNPIMIVYYWIMRFVVWW